jgi:hypothetical protein
VDDLVGFVVAILPWDSYFTNVLPGSMVVVLQQWWHYTYQLDGPDAIFSEVSDFADMELTEVRVLQHNFSHHGRRSQYLSF